MEKRKARHRNREAVALRTSLLASERHGAGTQLSVWGSVPPVAAAGSPGVLWHPEEPLLDPACLGRACSVGAHPGAQRSGGQRAALGARGRRSPRNAPHNCQQVGKKVLLSNLLQHARGLWNGQKLCQEPQRYYYYYLKSIPDVRGTLRTKIIDGPCPLKLKIARTQPQTTMSAAAESRSAAAAPALAKEHGLHPLSRLLLHLTCANCSHRKVFFSHSHGTPSGKGAILVCTTSVSPELAMAPGEEPPPRRTHQRRARESFPGRGGEGAGAPHHPHGQQPLPPGIHPTTRLLEGLPSFAVFRRSRDQFPRTNSPLLPLGITAAPGRRSAAPAGALLAVPAPLCNRWSVCILTRARIILTVVLYLWYKNGLEY